MKKVSLALLALLAMAAAYFFLRPDEGSKIDYLTEPVIRGDLTRTVNASGEVGAVELVSVGAQVSGQIMKLHVAVGQQVRKGDLIAEIDSIPQINVLETDKARLESYESQLVSRRVALEVARSKYQRERKLKKRDAASDESLEEARNALALAEAQVDETQSLIRQMRITVNTDEVNLGYTRISAPLDGTVVSVPVDEGQTVNANQTTPTIAQIADLNRMELKLEISEGDVTAVQPGMPVRYSILAEPEKTYETRLSSIDPGLTTLSDGSYKTSSSGGISSASSSASAVYYYGKAVIDNSSGPLRIGMTVQSVITVAEAKGVLLAPVVAVRRQGGKKMARVLLADGQVEEREVKTGLSDGFHVEILSGLTEGEELVTAELTAQEIEAETQRRPRRPR